MIVITTPTGRIGRQLLERLLDAGEPLRVIVRDPGRLPADVRDHVDVVPGSHGDADVVDRAFAGADSVFWVIPPDFQGASVEANYSGFTRPACDAFVRHRVARVVGISALGRGVTDHAGFVTASLAKDDLIASTGVAYRALTMPGFMDNLLDQVEPIRTQGVFFSTLAPDRRMPICATADIADVAARLLLDHSWSQNAAVPVLGAEDLSLDEMARIMSAVLGTTVRYRRLAIDAFRDQLRERGLSDAMVQGMVEMMVAKDAGLDNAEPRTPAATTPTSFRQWCEDVLAPAVREAGSVVETARSMAGGAR
jgi:uncharacterized protein YbjT (DUF2867 family)